MPSTANDAQEKKSVLLLCSDAHERQRISNAIASSGRYLAVAYDVEAGSNMDTTAPYAIVLDVGDGSLLDSQPIPPVQGQRGGVPIIFVSDVLSPDRTRQVVKLSPRDWLQRPFSDADLLDALGHLAAAGAHTSHVTTFIAASGGAGATTIALLAARYLAHRGKATSACLIDLDFQAANCSAYLNAANTFDLDALITNPERLDAELMDLMRREVAQRVALYSFDKPMLYFAPNGAKFVLGLLDQAASRYDQIVIDLPNLRTAWFDDVVRNSDRVTVVLELNVPSLTHARQLANHIVSLREGKRGLEFIINKSEFRLFGNIIARKDVERMLDGIPFHTVADDRTVMLDAINRGLVPSEIAPRSRAVREISELFAEWAGPPSGQRTAAPRRKANS